MKRIGRVASQMAQGNVCKYNWMVVGISVFLAVLVFLACIFCVLGVLLLMSLLVRGIMHKSALGGWVPILKIASLCVGGVVGILTLLAIGLNVKVRK